MKDIVFIIVLVVVCIILSVALQHGVISIAKSWFADSISDIAKS